MTIYAGIDEAGYGPMFGPFVVGRSVFAVEGHEAAGDCPALWDLLERAVCKVRGDAKRRIAVNDSKKLYTPKSGLHHLERGVLAFARCCGAEPAELDDWLEAVGCDHECRLPELLWYDHRDTPTPMPVALDGPQIAIAHNQLRLAMEAAGVALKELKAAIVFEDRYNRIVQATRSKARCSWTFIAQHLDAIWRQFGLEHPQVYVDRQGGRSRYRRVLSLAFPEVHVDVLGESTISSRYELRDGDRRMTVSFDIESEQSHLPVALASMTAKYTREILMHRFNAFWQQHAPDIKPTRGYVQDGRRFLKEIEPVIERLGIPREALIRQL